MGPGADPGRRQIGAGSPSGRLQPRQEGGGHVVGGLSECGRELHQQDRTRRWRGGIVDRGSKAMQTGQGLQQLGGQLRVGRPDDDGIPGL